MSPEFYLHVGIFQDGELEPFIALDRDAVQQIVDQFADAATATRTDRGDGWAAILGYIDGHAILFRDSGFIAMDGQAAASPRVEAFLDAICEHFDCAIHVGAPE